MAEEFYALMVNLVMPPTDPLEPPKPVKARNLRQLAIYLFYILLVALILAGLWYAQTSGYLAISY